MTYFLFKAREKLGFDGMLAKIRPQSAYGRELQKSLAPLNRPSLKREFDRLEQVIEAVGALKPGRLTEVRTRFSQLPSLEESLVLLDAGATLHDIALFDLRKFTVLAVSIRGLTRSAALFSEEDRRPLSFPPSLEARLKAGDGKYSFSIKDFATEGLLKAQERTRALHEELRETRELAVREIREKLPPRLKGSWHQEGLTVNKMDTGLVEELKKVPALKQAAETFASVQFARVPSKAEAGLNKELAEAEEQQDREEQKARSLLSQFLRPYAAEYRAACRCLGWMDWAIARAAFALEEGAVVPEVTDSTEISIKRGFYPALRDELAAQGRDFYPLDICLKAGATVITGANMGGKRWP